MSKFIRNSLTAAIVILSATAATVAGAQPYMPGPSMMGYGMMGYGMMAAPTCEYGPRRFSFDRIANSLKLNDAQRAKYEDLVVASRAATETMRNNCNADLGSSMPSRLESMETRMATMLAAIQTMRPPLDAFYASLTDAQKAQFDAGSVRGPFGFMRRAW